MKDKNKEIKYRIQKFMSKNRFFLIFLGSFMIVGSYELSSFQPKIIYEGSMPKNITVYNEQVSEQYSDVIKITAKKEYDSHYLKYRYSFVYSDGTEKTVLLDNEADIDFD